MNELPKIGEFVRVWCGPDFVREGRVIGRDEHDREVLVRFVYDIPDEWVRESKLC